MFSFMSLFQGRYPLELAIFSLKSHIAFACLTGEKRHSLCDMKPHKLKSDPVWIIEYLSL